ncbi:molybdenum cofactor guanylyltransferase [Colwellia sp. MB02u-18]|uniref:molybdenum cofactor guanylyltransferase n=1 Tax=unclassified Colwellia TaxID=196834 RepID=UPI0015F514E9|nr:MULTISPECIES: molybdenum cofactor guanylyltransferase [unclassified Colwellia]MBA6224551.1 molybdenum cofactor guanylyltransferase [Colwellia sp. MB3u-45]MBA6268137.1 molybdenum cofactor guanylyltransferase [Colwellia sp. MB3u-43]MBA6322589.1 molybdenum cofactor guanylyltransferase [Colwellia sp. MB02u-19]MBA6326167.1 molybdenum cofactor guanylyltransferase [Colwellia sp. MB02u-18]MBA6331626.1 molybdenum cofactor guanylyltransferase [Colwellia sp. MB02u-12]
MAVANTLFQPCLGVVLAGGKSSRMGQDKASLQREKQDMLSYSMSLLKAAGSSQVLVSGGEQGIDDLVANLGPLGGIQSIIKQFKPQALLILPVDLPLMTSVELARLKQVGELSNQACYFTDNYLPLYLPVNAFVEQFFQQLLTKPHSQASSRPDSPLKSKTSFSHEHVSADKAASKRNLTGPSVRSLLAQIPHKVVTPKNSKCLFNTNTPEQWQQAQHLLSLQRKSHV